MNQREKVLLAIVGSILVVFAGWAIKGAYSRRWADLAAGVRARKQKLALIEAKHVEAAAAESQWRKLGRQTLSMDEKEAKTLLRDELVDLARASGMPDASVDLGLVRPWLRNDIRVLNVSSVKAEGSLDEIVEFLFKLERQPYMVRCKSLTVVPVVDRGGRSRSGSGKPTPTGRFSMTVKLDTLILPANKRVARITPAVLAKDKRKEVERTLFARLEDYSVINRELFEPYQPPIPLPGKAASPSPGDRKTVGLTPDLSLGWRVGSHAKRHQIYFGEKLPDEPVQTLTAATYKPRGLVVGKTYQWRVDEINDTGTTQGEVWSFTTTEPEKVPPPPPPKPVDGDLVLRGTLSSPLVQEVILVDPRNRNAEEKRVELGQEMYNGTLVFVHPKGGVTERKDGSRRFHPVGLPLEECRLLSESEHPLICHELAKLEGRSVGISKE